MTPNSVLIEHAGPSQWELYNELSPIVVTELALYYFHSDRLEVVIAALDELIGEAEWQIKQISRLREWSLRAFEAVARS